MKFRSAWGTRMSGVCLLLVLACAGRAGADNTLVFNGYNNAENISFTFGGNTYNVNGGDIVPSTLNNSALSILYCVQFSVDVQQGVNYTHTNVNTLGLIDGNPLTNVGEVAYLLNNVATKVGGDLVAQAGLQAAIWYEVSGGRAGGFVLSKHDSSTGVYDAFKADLALLGADPTKSTDTGAGLTAAVNSLYYITPDIAGQANAQGLVTLVSSYTPNPNNPLSLSTPEPSTAMMAVTGGIVAVGLLRRRRRANAQ